MSLADLPAAARAALALPSSRLRAAWLKAPHASDWRFAIGEAAWLFPLVAKKAIEWMRARRGYAK